MAKLYRLPKDRRHGHDGILVRIIESTLDDPQRPGRRRWHRRLVEEIAEEVLPRAAIESIRG